MTIESIGNAGFNPISDIVARVARAAGGAQPAGKPANGDSTGTTGNTAEAIQYARTLLGWMLVLVLLAAISRSRLGYVVIYYSLVLGIVLLVLGSAPQLTDLLSLVRAPSGPSQET